MRGKAPLDLKLDRDTNKIVIEGQLDAMTRIRKVVPDHDQKVELSFVPKPAGDCSEVIRDASDMTCLRQFCAGHRELGNCAEL